MTPENQQRCKVRDVLQKLDVIAATAIHRAGHVAAVGVRCKSSIADGQTLLRARGGIGGRDVRQMMIDKHQFAGRQYAGRRGMTGIIDSFFQIGQQILEQTVRPAQSHARQRARQIERAALEQTGVVTRRRIAAGEHIDIILLRRTSDSTASIAA